MVAFGSLALGVFVLVFIVRALLKWEGLEFELGQSIETAHLLLRANKVLLLFVLVPISIWLVIVFGVVCKYGGTVKGSVPSIDTKLERQ